MQLNTWITKCKVTVVPVDLVIQSEFLESPFPWSHPHHFNVSLSLPGEEAILVECRSSCFVLGALSNIPLSQHQPTADLYPDLRYILWVVCRQLTLSPNTLFTKFGFSLGWLSQGCLLKVLICISSCYRKVVLPRVSF